MTVRRGLTLFEVVIALAIFMISVVGLTQLVNVGTENALNVQQQAEASQLCQSKLAEVIVGAETADSGEVIQNGWTWQWKVEKNQAEIEGLFQVNVTLSYERQDGTIIRASLSQMVLDPTIRGTTHFSTDSSSTTNSSSSSPTTSPSTTTTTPSTTTPSTGTNTNTSTSKAGGKS